MKLKGFILFVILGVVLLALFCVDLSVGSTDISIREIINVLLGKAEDSAVKTIVLDIRLSKSLVAILCGIALSISGLQMQTLFNNPLAGPYTLGVSSGASLGVALFILGTPFLTSVGLSGGGFIASLGVVGAAWLGCGVVLAIVLFLSNRIRDIMVILILGIMFSSGVGAIVQIMQYLSSQEALKSFVVWTMGSLSDVTYSQLLILFITVFIGSLLGAVAVKPLNLLLLGENYAISMGVNVKRVRNIILLSTMLLAGSITAFCGPIGFIGLATPHVARGCFNVANHRVLLPASALIGAIVMLICNILSKYYAFPINTITALFGIPIVMWIVVKK